MLQLILSLCVWEPVSLMDAAEPANYGDFNAAIAILGAKLETDKKDLDAILALVEINRRLRQYDQAAWYLESAINYYPEKVELYTDRWDFMVQSAKDDSVDLQIIQRIITKEVEKALKNFDKEDFNRRLITYFGAKFTGKDSLEANAICDSILKLYPNIKFSFDIIGERFWDGMYPMWNDDAKKVEYFNSFIATYPNSEWTATAYSFLAYSLWNLASYEGLANTCESAMNEWSQDPRLVNSLSYYLLAAYENIDKHYQAIKCVLPKDNPHPGNFLLKPTWNDIALQHAIDFVPAEYEPQEQWRIKQPSLIPDAYFNQSRIEYYNGKLKSAKVLLDSALVNCRFTFQDELTEAPYYYFVGKVLLEMKDTLAALEALNKCLILGDRRNEWAGKADTLLSSFIPKAKQIDTMRIIANYHDVIFADVTLSAGIRQHTERRIAWVDLNNDGFDDLVLSGAVMKNNGNGTFADLTYATGITQGRGAVCADYDNDGDIDIFISANSGMDKLYENHGDFNFTQLANSPGDSLPTEGVAWVDVDHNGYPDLYLANYEAPYKKLEDMGKGSPDFLWMNNGDKTFSPIQMKPPFNEELCGRGVSPADFNQDGWSDIFVSVYRLKRNLLWANTQGKFSENGLNHGVAGNDVSDWWGHTIGSQWGDYDNDGDLDLVAANLAHPRYLEFSNRTMVYENQGAPDWRFIDRREQLGIKYDECHSEPLWGDVNNDGWLDLYITSVYENRRSYLYLNKLGTDANKFVDATYISGTRIFNGWGAAYSDYDNDGDLDLAVATQDGIKLFRNQTIENNPNSNWLQVKIQSDKLNRDGIGTQIILQAGEYKTIREVEGGKGTTNQSSLVQHFGLGNIQAPVQLKVRFPDSSIVEKTISKLNTRIVLTPTK